MSEENERPDPLTVGELISLAQASQESGLDHSFLRRLAGKGRLAAKKIGQDWLTTMAAVEDYKRSRHRGKKIDS